MTRQRQQTHSFKTRVQLNKASAQNAIVFILNHNRRPYSSVVTVYLAAVCSCLPLALPTPAFCPRPGGPPPWACGPLRCPSGPWAPRSPSEAAWPPWPCTPPGTWPWGGRGACESLANGSREDAVSSESAPPLPRRLNPPQKVA